MWTIAVIQGFSEDLNEIIYMKRIVYIMTTLLSSSPLIVWPFLGEVDPHDQLPLIPEPLFLCNRSFHMSKGESIARGSGRFPSSLSPGEACQLMVACSNLASSPLYTFFLWFSASTRRSQALLLHWDPYSEFVVVGLFFMVRCLWERV